MTDFPVPPLPLNTATIRPAFLGVFWSSCRESQSLEQEEQFPPQEVNPSSPMASRSGINFIYLASCSARIRFCSSVMDPIPLSMDDL